MEQTRLGEMCDFLIKNNDTSVYRIAQMTGIERTKLQRMVKGKDSRRLQPKEFEKFCDSLRMGKKDREQLYEMYMIERIGRKKYENRKCIMDILEYMNSARIEMENRQKTFGESVIVKKKSGSSEREMEYADTPLQVKGTVGNAVEESFCQKEKTIYTNISVKFREFFENIEYCYQAYHHLICVKHYLLFHVNPTVYYNENCNLEILRDILPWMFSADMEYQPYFTYSNSMVEDMGNIVMPYYILTESSLILLTTDMSRAILCRQPEVLRGYREKVMESNRSEMNPLVFQKCNLKTLIENSISYSKEMGRILYSLEPCPCLGMLVPPEVMKMMLERGVVEDVKHEDTVRSWNVNRSMEGSEMYHPESYTNYFSEEGLQYFCETGKVKAQLGTWFKAADPAERRQILERMIQILEQGEDMYHMTKGNFPILWDAHVEIYQHGLLLMLFVGEDEFWVILIRESSICESFVEFIKTMEDTGLAVGKEETEDVLKRYRDGLEAEG